MIQTELLTLVPNTVEDARALIDNLDPAQRAEVSSAWLDLLNSPSVDAWALGYRVVHRASGEKIGTCGFKGPPDGEATVEIAYGVDPEQQNQGYATEAAEALVAYAFSTDQVRVVRAHTFQEANASTRVLAKCGFQSMGEVVDPEDGLVWRWEISKTRAR